MATDEGIDSDMPHIGKINAAKLLAASANKKMKKPA
jgi:hypothetical protein